MSGIEVRPFRRSDRQQLTDLVNSHVQAVVPAAGGPRSCCSPTWGRWPGRCRHQVCGWCGRSETVRDWELPAV